MQEMKKPKENLFNKIILDIQKLMLKIKTLFQLRNKRNILSLLGRIILYAVLIVISYIFLSPLIEIVSKSFMNQKDIVDPEVFFIPKTLTFANFKVASTALNLWGALWNSIWFSALIGIIQTIICAFTAYAFARYNFKFKKLWFALLVISFVIPTQVLIVPRITVFKTIQDFTHIKMMNSLLPSILTTFFGQGVYSAILILIFYNFFKQIPYDLDEAAYIDGASSFQVLYHVILKLSLPIILTVFLFSFVWNWNETIMTNNFIRNSLSLIPGQLAMFDALFANNSNQTGVVDLNEGYKMAGTLLSILPLIILYVVVQKRFIEGIEQTGITGL